MKNTIQQIRSFNRFYTSHIGMLKNNFLDSPYSLSEVRLLYEIGEHPTVNSQQLSEFLNLDKGYVSRVLKLFLKDNIIRKVQSNEDKRAFYIELTDEGDQLLKILQSKSDRQIEEIVHPLHTGEKEMLVNSMRSIKNLLSPDYNKANLAKDVEFREGLKPGDIGYLIHLHGKLYTEESGYSQDFEKYVIKTFSEFLENYSPENDKIWLAEYNQQIVGCVAILQRSSEEAQLRWFLTLPMFRGTGIGKKLLNTALDYCKDKKYKNLYLLTTSFQEKAIAMYEKVGFVKTESVESVQWGQLLVEERFDLTFN
ncbi:GCN5 family acetyltransferase [Chryseobacterium formosense]|uniref:GCN5 family acetyltransferase n=1 Tax=Chryseobacterium formosense TaxID=236814 RepID=A0A085Z5F2_9FLAO|nr:bifunctional helix-turn-helix transcriptional regulator/GNAT family N-acetyltransferase [Chryseobacterium formosense]KFE99665.1 GCN5 family acetyltransferase [Chryseobacterium formosense]SFT79478.1 transcriptional regulator, MarR family with acetyltransferase activity [Chryseobacterium formosense]